MLNGDVMELADIGDLESPATKRAGSSPVIPTNLSRMWCNLVTHLLWEQGLRFKSDIFDH